MADAILETSKLEPNMTEVKPFFYNGQTVIRISLYGLRKKPKVLYTQFDTLRPTKESCCAAADRMMNALLVNKINISPILMR